MYQGVEVTYGKKTRLVAFILYLNNVCFLTSYCEIKVAAVFLLTLR